MEASEPEWLRLWPTLSKGMTSSISFDLYNWFKAYFKQMEMPFTIDRAAVGMLAVAVPGVDVVP